MDWIEQGGFGKQMKNIEAQKAVYIAIKWKKGLQSPELVGISEGLQEGMSP